MQFQRFQILETSFARQCSYNYNFKRHSQKIEICNFMHLFCTSVEQNEWVVYVVGKNKLSIGVITYRKERVQTGGT